MLSDDLAAALDPSRYAAAAGYDLDPWQRDVVRSTSRRLSLNITRQGGKSTSVAVKAMHLATYHEDALILLLSPGLRQSGELFRRCQTVKNGQPHSVTPLSETKLSMELANGSRIISLPGSEETIRGYSGPALICIDEAARVPDAVYKAVRPMLARSQGQLVTLSTPFGNRGWWADEWHSERTWERYELTAAECPHIDAQFLADEMATLGQYWFEQEYCLKFQDAQDSAFQKAYIDAAIEEGLEEWDLTALKDLHQQLAVRS